MIIQIILAVVLIVAVALQTTKGESGLSGIIGGAPTSSFHGRPGREEQVENLTKWSAIIFMVVSILVAVATNKGL